MNPGAYLLVLIPKSSACSATECVINQVIVGE